MKASINVKYFLTFLTIAALFTVGLTLPARAQLAEGGKEIMLYERPTMEKISKLYWRLSRLNIDNKSHIDSYMRINECDIFKDYYNNEFKWREIQKAAQGFIEKNKDNFPIRFQFVQPLRLGEYDVSKKVFNLYEPYIIKSTRRFEVKSNDAGQKICGIEGRTIEDYPDSLVLELSRPYGLKSFPLDEDTASEYISEKLQALKNMNKIRQKKEDAFMARDAYLVMKVKIFSSHEEPFIKTHLGSPDLAQVLAVLEGVEIYADKDLQKLLYVETFRKKRTKSALELKYISEYQQEKRERLKETTKSNPSMSLNP